MDEEYDFEDKSEQEVQKYSKSTEKTLLQAVSALERYQDRLTIFASWLNLHTLESAAAHVTEAETLATAT